MTTLEQEIVEKFHQSDKDGQKRVFALIEREIEMASPAAIFDHNAWLRDIEDIREQIRAAHQRKFPSVDAIGMLREIRDGEDE